jgi:hypothetical protein
MGCWIRKMNGREGEGVTEGYFETVSAIAWETKTNCGKRQSP